MNQFFSSRYPEFRFISTSLRKCGDDYYFAAERKGNFYLVIGEKSFRFIEEKDAPSVLKKTFPFLNPVSAGSKNSFGFGDRTGLATPGHIRAVKGSGFFPVFAQQSARELERTGRSFSDVINDVILWSFIDGWSEGFGADADHAKTIDVIQKAISAGYTYFTIDPSDKIKKLENFSVQNIRNLELYLKNYSGKNLNIEDSSFVFNDDNTTVLSFLYGDALDFIEECYRFISERMTDFDFEVSVDETGIPTSPLAHIFIVMELQRRKINFNSIALRFPGRFEKGIDYIGDINVFSKELEVHNRIRNYLGPYKISLHSGSDKFSVYSPFKKIVGEMFHIKTSGTSWIQAMKTIAAIDREFFVECIDEFIRQFEKNSVSYEISADISRINMNEIKTGNIDELFSDRNLRQLIHISYGTVLGCDTKNKLRNNFYDIIRKNLDMYVQFVEEHLKKHIKLLS
ncbi:MAG: hypothetical protein BWX89_00355 [candidate division TA06 bacterium ADurb.Bin131]|jgi:hypothetical protein|uniref:Tagaturonate/fructuronate epimerase n=1 Tax=candidate division TA06 bacterium ADurb.Bin131 TaxID=1852827 RepID=A0A1V6CDD1_UNCT6|nr:MAG: hypothetical protein BWX89_00355 [candidate division TA06 bacterium ADurb.Bin131]HOC02416.1 tagaturonate epimerase family protein [bacterium]HON06125.1 tagaturonate epimerase family protein [bacterium]HQL64489.1 tagaturonate epimerase family protein [bacterium]